MAKSTMAMTDLSRNSVKAQNLAQSAPLFLEDTRGQETHVLISVREYKSMFTAALMSLTGHGEMHG